MNLFYQSQSQKTLKNRLSMFIAYPKTKLQIKVATGLFNSVKSRISHSELSYVQEAYECKDHSIGFENSFKLDSIQLLKIRTFFFG